MLKILLMGAIITIGAAGSSFASVNTYPVNYKPKSTPVFKGSNGFLPNKNSHFQLTTGDVTLYKFQELANATSFSNNISGNVSKIAVDRVASETKELSDLQIKYAERLNVLPELLDNMSLLESLDYWYGTRYVYGGTTKRGIDCSAFVRAMYESVYDIELPRTAREQYKECRRISTTELKEGDLVFFNTRGGVSHVGIYIRNNKFAHSSSGRGVVISDLFEDYYVSRYIGAGRLLDNDSKITNPFLVKK